MTNVRTKNIDEKYCEDCGSIIKSKAEICPNCGVRQHIRSIHINSDQSSTDSYLNQNALQSQNLKSPLKALDEKFCTDCGSTINQKAEICPKCGVRQHSSLHSINDNIDQVLAGVTQKIPMTQYYFDALKKFAVFQGRTTRKEFLRFCLVDLIIRLILILFCAVIDNQLLVSVYSLVMIIPGIAALVRRYHDNNRSGWWILVPIASLILLFMKSNPTDNRFGKYRKIS